MIRPFVLCFHSVILNTLHFFGIGIPLKRFSKQNHADAFIRPFNCVCVSLAIMVNTVLSFIIVSALSTNASLISSRCIPRTPSMLESESTSKAIKSIAYSLQRLWFQHPCRSNISSPISMCYFVLSLDNRHTVSTCPVWGNISTGRAKARR